MLITFSLLKHMFAFSICHSLIQLWLTQTICPEWTAAMKTVCRLTAESHLICDEFLLAACSSNLSAVPSSKCLKNIHFQIEKTSWPDILFHPRWVRRSTSRKVRISCRNLPKTRKKKYLPNCKTNPSCEKIRVWSKMWLVAGERLSWTLKAKLYKYPHSATAWMSHRII